MCGSLQLTSLAFYGSKDVDHAMQSAMTLCLELRASGCSKPRVQLRAQAPCGDGTPPSPGMQSGQGGGPQDSRPASCHRGSRPASSSSAAVLDISCAPERAQLLHFPATARWSHLETCRSCHRWGRRGICRCRCLPTSLLACSSTQVVLLQAKTKHSQLLACCVASQARMSSERGLRAALFPNGRWQERPGPPGGTFSTHTARELQAPQGYHAHTQKTSSIGDQRRPSTGQEARVKV